jgi:cytoskeletal protein RodZ
VSSQNGRTIGETLRAAREKKGLSIDKAHDTTKISPEVIRALEQDDHGSFASETYLKGFLRNYASFLGLDGNMLWKSFKSDDSDSTEGASAVWDDETALKEEKLKSPHIFRKYVVPCLVIVIIVLATLLVIQNRKVKNMTTGANSHNVEVEVAAFAPGAV